MEYLVTLELLTIDKLNPFILGEPAIKILLDLRLIELLRNVWMVIVY